MMEKMSQLESIFNKLSCPDFKWIEPTTIFVAQWVRMKCIYGCGQYGRNAACPPNVPSVAECERFLLEYERATVFHFTKEFDNPEDRHEWTREINTRLLGVEREVFLLGYQKVFLLFMGSCNLCFNCAGSRNECKEPKLSRPTPEAMGIDVYSTMRSLGYPIDVLEDYSKPMNRYAILLIE